MKIVAFNGSPRKDGNTVLLLNSVLRKLEEFGADTELVHLTGQPVRGCAACMQCRKNQNRRCTIESDKVNEWMTKMFTADGILIGSPTFFANVTTETKALIDRAGYVARGNGNLLRRKVGAAVVAVRRAGALIPFNAINDFFLINEMIVPGSSYWNIGVGRDIGEVGNDEEGIRTMETLGENMAWLLEKTNG